MKHEIFPEIYDRKLYPLTSEASANDWAAAKIESKKWMGHFQSLLLPTLV